MSFESTPEDEAAPQVLDTPEEPTTSPVDELVQERGGIPGSDGAAPAVEEPSAEPTSATPATETPTEPAAEPTPEPPSWREMDETKAAQSSWDRQIANERNLRIAAENRTAALEQQSGETSREAQVAATRQRVRQDAISQGYTEAEAERMATQMGDSERSRLTSEAEVTRLQQEQEQAQNQSVAQSKEFVITKAIEFYGLRDTDREFLNYDSVDAISAAAQRLAPAKPATETPVAAPTPTQTPEVPVGEPVQVFDSGTGSAGAMTDDQILAAYADENQADPPFATVEAILRKRGEHPLG